MTQRGKMQMIRWNEQYNTIEMDKESMDDYRWIEQKKKSWKFLWFKTTEMKTRVLGLLYYTAIRKRQHCTRQQKNWLLRIDKHEMKQQKMFTRKVTIKYRATIVRDNGKRGVNSIRQQKEEG